jgi:hypothetical protein
MPPVLHTGHSQPGTCPPEITVPCVPQFGHWPHPVVAMHRILLYPFCSCATAIGAHTMGWVLPGQDVVHGHPGESSDAKG